MKKITRGLTQDYINEIQKTDFLVWYKNNQKQLRLEIRNNYINLYYNSASVGKIEYHPKNEQHLICKTHKKYLNISNQDKEYEEISIKRLQNEAKNIMKNIEKKVYKPKSHQEKAAQHILVQQNNANEQSKWFCIDTEYVMQRYSKDEEVFGRWDIIAITKRPPYKVALIELKYTLNALGGKSGMVKHIEDHINFSINKNNLYETHLKQEIVDVVNSLNKLKLCSIKINNKAELVDKPEFYFIALNNKGDIVRKTMRKYLFEGEPKSNPKTITVEKKLGINVTMPNKYNYNPTFLFSKDTWDNIKITDILEGEQYEYTHV